MKKVKVGDKVKVPNGLGYSPAKVVAVDESRGVALIEYDNTGGRVGHAIKVLRPS